MTQRNSWALGLSALLLAGGCFDPARVPGGPPRGYETDELSCSDGLDNDQDGFIDCGDVDCVGRFFCGEIIPGVPVDGFEGDFETCTDGIDNDVNGQFDCGDRKCQAVQELCCVTEFSDVTCSDGIDNDGNGFADCEDFGCRQGTFTTVCARELDCTDGLDNDADGFTDCEDRDCGGDPSCIVDSGPENTTSRCIDGDDNDGNGFVDCREFGCCDSMGMCIDGTVQSYCDSLPSEDSEAACTDGIDNDGNGFLDCGEFGCCDRDGLCITSIVQSFCDSMPTEDTFELCTDGIDNDADGFLDCNDNSCSQSDNADLKRICEASYDSCTDGIDNDDDGFYDCSDRSCQGVLEARAEFDGREVSPCLESMFTPDDIDERNPNTTEQALRNLATRRCQDGLDGDADGFIDCDDWDCQWNPLLNPKATDASTTEPGGLCQGFRFDEASGRWIVPTPAQPGLTSLRCQ